MTAMQIIKTAYDNKIMGRLVKTRYNGREIRAYTISGTTYNVEAWHSEHVKIEDFQ